LVAIGRSFSVSPTVKLQTSNHLQPLQIQDAIKKSLFDIKNAEIALQSEFENVDLNILKNSFVEIHQIVRKYFTDSPFWTLFWKSDYFVTGLKHRLQKSTLLTSEFQMVYATGRAKGMIAAVGSLVKENLDNIKDERIAPILDTVPTAQFLLNTKSIDQFALRNQIAMIDDSVYYNELSHRIYELVKWQFIGQVQIH
jgi:hypothetical protein